MRISYVAVMVVVCVVNRGFEAMPVNQPSTTSSATPLGSLLNSLPLVGPTLSSSPLVLPITNTLDPIISNVPIVPSLLSAPGSVLGLKSKRDLLNLSPLFDSLSNLPVVGGVLGSVLGVVPIGQVVGSVVKIAQPVTNQLPVVKGLLSRRSEKDDTDADDFERNLAEGQQSQKRIARRQLPPFSRNLLISSRRSAISRFALVDQSAHL